jgi:fucose permease
MAAMWLFMLWESKTGAWVAMIMMGAAYYTTITAVNICLLSIIDEHTKKYMLYVYAMFGVGGISSPQVVQIFEHNSYYYIPAFFLVMLIGALVIKAPGSDSGKQKKEGEKKEEGPAKIFGSSKSAFLISLSLFVLLGVEYTVSGWIPSYTVVTGVSGKKEATQYATIYYVMVIAMRLTSSKITLANKKKLVAMLVGMVSTTVLCLYFQFGQDFATAALVGSYGYGISCALVYPLIMLLPSEYGMAFRPEQTANIMMGTVFSSGFLTGLTGTLMTYDIQLLFYSLLTMSGTLLILIVLIMSQLKKESEPAKTQKKVKAGPSTKASSKKD